ncbi:hypothetical protein ACJW31_11G110000 [Castanea mollissima]
MGTKFELVISKYKESENWTKVSFKPDLAKFNMTHLEDDEVALMKKRVFELAGCLEKSVKFIASCGKFFEGTPEQMYQSLCNIGFIAKANSSILWP